MITTRLYLEPVQIRVYKAEVLYYMTLTLDPMKRVELHPLVNKLSGQSFSLVD